MTARSHKYISLFSALTCFVGGAINAQEESEYFTPAEQNTVQEAPATPFSSFTGRITRNKVRMRLSPSLEAPILREMAKDELLIITGESEDFYAVMPPKDSKAYVFRTFILDNKVEGNKVNVRLEPAIEAPVVAQLNNGDEIHGSISPLNSKWYEIPTPSTTRFYVCKEYVEKIGSPSVMAQIEKRREEVNNLLNLSYQQGITELDKEYSTMNIEPVIANYNKIIREYGDFPDQSSRAKELLAGLQETVLQKKIAYLEAKAANATQIAQQAQITPQAIPQNQVYTPSLDNSSNQNQYVEDYSTALPVGANSKPDWNKAFDSSTMTSKMAAWIPVEQTLYNMWAERQDNPTPESFYEQQMEDTITLTGILEAYSRSVKNKPGDFLLVSSANGLPIAYLYSTNVNLQERLGHVTTVHAVKRANNNFAFPAYFVISTE